MPLRVRVTVSLPNNSQFDSETVTVSRYGAKLRLAPQNRTLVCGDHVRVNLRGAYAWRTARIAWLDRAGYCGIELQDPENFWGLYFPLKANAETEVQIGTHYTPLAVRDAN